MYPNNRRNRKGRKEPTKKKTTIGCRLAYDYVGSLIPLLSLAGYQDIDFDENIVDLMLKRLFESKRPGSISPEVWEHEFRQMSDALADGYGKTGVEWGGTDWAFMQNLRYNTAVFDAFKCNRENQRSWKLLTWDRRDTQNVGGVPSRCHACLLKI